MTFVYFMPGPTVYDSTVLATPQSYFSSWARITIAIAIAMRKKKIFFMMIEYFVLAKI